MILFPSEDGFLTSLQETGSAVANYTGSDDLCIVTDSIRAKVWQALAINVRIFNGGDRRLTVWVRND